MSSSPLTDAPVDRPARWRSPAGWPLRTRIVATMIVLLTVLGLAVGGTAEIFLRKQLYDQIDTRVNDAQNRSHFIFNQQQDPGGDPRGPGGGNFPGGTPPTGVQSRTIIVQLSPTDKSVLYGGILRDSSTDFN